MIFPSGLVVMRKDDRDGAGSQIAGWTVKIAINKILKQYNCCAVYNILFKMKTKNNKYFFDSYLMHCIMKTYVIFDYFNIFGSPERFFST